MALSIFDRKFGPAFFSALPSQPGVYLFFDTDNQPIYVGKAKNLRRRLGQYRNAKRCKRHHRMRSILKQATRLEFQVCASELDASLREIRLIQQLRPKWNLAGAFHFLYPLIGMKREANGDLVFCYTTRPALFPSYEFHGAYRSREITGEAYFAWMNLLRYLYHPQTRSRKKPRDRVKHAYVFGFRNLDDRFEDSWRRFLRGESMEALEILSIDLLESARARAESQTVQELLRKIRRFWRHETVQLRRACRELGEIAYPIPQQERDLLFLKFRDLIKEKRPRKRGLPVGATNSIR